MPVNTTNKEYSANVDKWLLIRDCEEGSKAIKSRSGGGDGTKTLNGTRGTAYLPAPNASDTSDENKERYAAYRERASFVNFTGQTMEGIIGLIFRKETKIEPATSVAYLKENANGGGLSTDQMIKDVTNDVIGIGRHGLLVDYPNAPSGLTEAEVRALNLRANILAYPAETVINWRTETIGGVTMLTMVVLQEPTEVKEDEFSFKEVMYHRVLLLVKGVYIQNLYNDNDELVTYPTGKDEADGTPIVTGDIIPRNNAGGTWNEIPFIFVGSINNDPGVDKAPMYDIAEVNIAHYRNSADYEESSFLVGQPTPVFIGLSNAWAKDVLKGGVALGSRAAIPLPEGGDAKLLQADPNSMPLEGMKIKEDQLIKLGARLIVDTGSNETVDAARMRYAGQNSKAGTIIINVQAAFLKCYGWAAEFMGGTGETELKINTEFYDASIDPQRIIAEIQLMDRGVIAKKDLRDNLRKGNLISAERTDEEIDNDAETADPLTGGNV
jgi:hypothetical protein